MRNLTTVRRLAESTSESEGGHAGAASCRSDPNLRRLSRGRSLYRAAGQTRRPFDALAESIAYQQLSGKAAATIFGRVRALYPRRKWFSPELIIATPDEKFRAAGLSRSKTTALKDLAAKTLDGTVPTRAALDRMSDEEISLASQQCAGSAGGRSKCSCSSTSAGSMSGQLMTTECAKDMRRHFGRRNCRNRRSCMPSARNGGPIARSPRGIFARTGRASWADIGHRGHTGLLGQRDPWHPPQRPQAARPSDGRLNKGDERRPFSPCPVIASSLRSRNENSRDGRRRIHRLASRREAARRRPQVSILDDFNDFYDPEIKRGNIAAVADKIAVHQADLRDSRAVNEFFIGRNSTPSYTWRPAPECGHPSVIRSFITTRMSTARCTCSRPRARSG